LTIEQPILKNNTLDSQLWRDGYVVIPFLNNDEVQQLLKVFHENHPKGIEGFYATAHTTDIDFRQKMNLEIRKAYNRAIEENFINCRPLGGSFIAKAPNSEEALQPHQDWNIVDETLFRSFNIWVPLVDLTDKNGAIYVLRGSHNWHRGYRHLTIPCAYGKVYNAVWQNMIPLYMKAGEALIYDHALVHASDANKSTDVRVACAYGIIPEQADMRFYWNNNGQVEEYAVTPEFFMTQNVFTGPHGLTKIADNPYDFHQLNEDEFYRLAQIEKPVKTFNTGNGWLIKLKSIFS
jgi:hypothetical protein